MKCSYKKICALILTLVMALSVTGCTDDSSSSLPEEKPSFPYAEAGYAITAEQLKLRAEAK